MHIFVTNMSTWKVLLGVAKFKTNSVSLSLFSYGQATSKIASDECLVLSPMLIHTLQGSISFECYLNT